MPQLEKALAQKRRPNTVKNKKNKKNKRYRVREIQREREGKSGSERDRDIGRHWRT